MEDLLEDTVEGYEDYLVLGLMQDYSRLREEWDRSYNILKFSETMVKFYLRQEKRLKLSRYFNDGRINCEHPSLRADEEDEKILRELFIITSIIFAEEKRTKKEERRREKKENRRRGELPDIKRTSQSAQLSAGVGACSGSFSCYLLPMIPSLGFPP